MRENLPIEPDREGHELVVTDKPTQIEREELVSGLLISHRTKGGDYVVKDVATPAGDSAREFGVIVTYVDAKNGNVYYRPIEDFIFSMVKSS